MKGKAHVTSFVLSKAEDFSGVKWIFLRLLHSIEYYLGRGWRPDNQKNIVRVFLVLGQGFFSFNKNLTPPPQLGKSWRQPAGSSGSSHPVFCSGAFSILLATRTHTLCVLLNLLLFSS